VIFVLLVTAIGTSLWQRFNDVLASPKGVLSLGQGWRMGPTAWSWKIAEIFREKLYVVIMSLPSMTMNDLNILWYQ
jgi:hypothetical protein